MFTDDPLKGLVALQAGPAEEEPAIIAESCRFGVRAVTGCIATADSLFAGHFLHNLPAFYVPGDSGALHRDTFSRQLLAA